MNSGLVIDSGLAAAGGVGALMVYNVTNNYGSPPSYWPALLIVGGAVPLFFLRGYPLGADMLLPLSLGAGASYLLTSKLVGMKINAL